MLSVSENYRNVLRLYYYTSSRGGGDKWPPKKNKTGAAGAPETGLMILSPLEQALGSLRRAKARLAAIWALRRARKERVTKP